MGDFLQELWAFMKERKKFWLLPIILVLVLLGSLIFLTQGSAVAPFICTLFSNLGSGCQCEEGRKSCSNLEGCGLEHVGWMLLLLWPAAGSASRTSRHLDLSPRRVR